MRLPKLLAAYRKYGSRADGCPVYVNHFWRSVADVDTTKNGTPMQNVRIASTLRIALEPSVGARLSATPMGVCRGLNSTASRNAPTGRAITPM